MPGPPKLSEVLAALRAEYPEAAPPAFRTPFEIVLFENVAYLVNDRRRQEVWDDFLTRIGTDPDDILDSDPDLLEEVLVPGGMHPSRRAEKVRTCSAILVEELGGDFDAVLDLPERERRKALRRFPGFGDPGVDKVLLLSRKQNVLALESNGLRVLLRLGFGSESRNYATTYRSVQSALAGELPKRIDQTVRAHFLLRAHGQAVCKNNRPQCAACCLQDRCPSATV